MRAGTSSSLYIDVAIQQGIAPITTLAATQSMTSTGTINLTWTEPYRSGGGLTPPYSYDIRVSTVGQIANDAVFSTSPVLSTFSPSVPPSPGTGGGVAAFNVNGLTGGVTYYFAIHEKDSAGHVDVWSRTLAPPVNVNNFVVALSMTPSPAGGSITGVSTAAATATWAVVADATDYMLIASTKAVNPPLLIAGSSTTLSSTATVSGLNANTTYFLFVTACGPGCSAYDALGSTVTLAAPAVSLSTTAVSSGTVSLAWLPNGNPSNTTYLVEVSTDGVSFSTAAPSLTTSTVVGGLSGATTYYFAVVAQNFAGVSAATSNVVAVETVLPSPSNGTVQSVTVSSITAAWTVVAGATDYVLVASTSPAIPPTLIAASSTTLSSTATVSGLAPNTSYFMFVSACGAGCSPFGAFGSTYTLAAPAVSLSSTSISSSTVNLAWGANGDPLGTTFLVQKSTDGVDFSTLFASTVPAALVSGLTGGTSYWFDVVAVNGAGVASAPSGVLNIKTPSGPTPSTPTGLTATAGLLSISLGWNALPPAQQGLGLADYRLLRSTTSGFGYVQVATTTGTSYVDRLLAAGVTEYYEIVARDIGGTDSAPSAAVSTAPFTVGPMEPIGVSVAAASTTVTIAWSPTSRFSDGTPFLTTGTPNGDELQGYSIWRSTTMCGPGQYVQVSSLTIASTTITDNTGGLNYYYRLYSYNSAGYSPNTPTFSTLGEFDYMVDECVSRLVLDAPTAAALNGATNGLGDIRILNMRRPQDVGNGIYQSVQWEAFLNGISPMSTYVLPKASRFILGFTENNGIPVPDTAPAGGFSALAAGPAGAPVSAGDLGGYWFNGQAYVKMYGSVDTVGQTVTVASPNLGIYQVRAQARSTSAVFDISGISSRVITPNGDGLNDTLIFSYDPGPNNVTPVGKIFDLRGAYVSDMTPGMVPNTLTWNGFMNGLPVHSGVYVYRITGDGKTFSGTVVVAR